MAVADALSAPAGLGVVWVVQLVPFHVMAIVVSVPLEVLLPTATQWVDDVHDTPFRPFAVPGLVVVCVDQEVPFHRIARVSLPHSRLPTAVQAVEEEQETPFNWF